MPAILIGPPRRNEHMWQALKTHITRERQRKKQEQEADEEEERLRKERERQQKQDVMTLGETREQISNLENELSELKDEKHQLFLQLKKVLNEDDRRRQFIKETSICSEALTVGGYPTAVPRMVHPQIFLPLPRSTSPLYKPSVAGQPTHILPNMGGTNSAIPYKRTHSPSPPPPAPSYHTTYYKQPPCIPNYNTSLPKSEEAARRSNDSRAVLWNKSNQYSFYTAPQAPTHGVYSYPTSASQSREASEQVGKPIYLSSRAPLTTHQTAYMTSLHSMEQHKGAYGEDKFYLRPSNHVIPIQQPPQGTKTGGITSGYPVRTPQPPPGPYSQPPPPVTYISASGANVSSRILYTQPGARYLQRDI